MIKLHKFPEPDILKTNKAEWTERYSEYINKGQPIPESLKYKYRDPQVKQIILEETHEKCVYCESKVTHVYPGDVEHIFPKSKKPEFIFEWLNLTFSCLECNRRKSDYYDQNMPLINPYEDEPADHFFFAGPMISHRPESDRGRLTRKRLDLNRPPLIERRTERLESIVNLIDLYEKCSEALGKEALLNELIREAEEDKEYAYMVQTFLQSRNII